MLNFNRFFKATLLALVFVFISPKIHAESCTIAVTAQLNMSLSPTTCTAAPTVSSVLVSAPCPGGTLVIQAYLGGVWVTNPVFNYSHVNQTYMFRVLDLVSGNAAWGNIKIEDKIAPVVTCAPAITVNCEQMCTAIPGPTYSDCDPTLTKTSTDFTTVLPCTSTHLKTIVRTYQATDDGGNTGTCNRTITVARRPLSSLVFPANITMQVNSTDCSPWCENFINNPAPSSTQNAAAFAPGVPTISGVPVVAVQNPTTGCNSVCIPDCGLSVSYDDAIFTLCGTNRRIKRTWNIINCSGAVSSFSQNITIYTDGNATCGTLCYRPTSLTHSIISSALVKFSWTPVSSCVQRYQVTYRFKTGSVWGPWTTTNTINAQLEVAMPAGAVQGEYYLRTACYGVNSPYTSTYSFNTIFLDNGTEDRNLPEGDATAEMNNNDLEIWPNPTQNEAWMELDQPLTTEAKLLVFSADGRLLSEQQLPAGTQQWSLDLSNQPKGMYFCQMRYEGTVTMKKVFVSEK